MRRPGNNADMERAIWALMDGCQSPWEHACVLARYELVRFQRLGPVSPGKVGG